MLIASTTAMRQLAALALTMPCIVSGAYLIWRIKEIQGWRETKGKILSIRSEGFFHSRVIVQYSYLAQGGRLEGNRVTVCDWILATGYIPVQKLIRMYPFGKEVTVYFDDRYPSRCILKKTGYFMPLLILGFGLIGEICLAWFIAEGKIMPPALRSEIIHI